MGRLKDTHGTPYAKKQKRTREDGKCYGREYSGPLALRDMPILLAYPKCNGMLLTSFQKKSFVVLKYVDIYEEKTRSCERG